MGETYQKQNNEDSQPMLYMFLHSLEIILKIKMLLNFYISFISFQIWIWRILKFTWTVIKLYKIFYYLWIIKIYHLSNFKLDCLKKHDFTFKMFIEKWLGNKGISFDAIWAMILILKGVVHV